MKKLSQICELVGDVGSFGFWLSVGVAKQAAEKFFGTKLETVTHQGQPIGYRRK